MPFELIRRKEGEISQKQEIRHKNIQISINDWGHLVIREFDEPHKELQCELGGGNNCVHRDPEAGNKECCSCLHYKYLIVYPEEHLIVFDQQTTNRLINFIFSVRSTYELKKLLKDLIGNKDSLPF